MSGDTRDFNNMETRAVINFFPLQGKKPKEIHIILTETLGEYAPSYATVKNWVAQFKRGDFSTCDAPRPGRPKTVTDQVITLFNTQKGMETRLAKLNWFEAAKFENDIEIFSLALVFELQFWPEISLFSTKY